MINSNDLVTLVTFTQPHRECLQFFYHDEFGVWCPGYGNVTLLKLHDEKCDSRLRYFAFDCCGN